MSQAAAARTRTRRRRRRPATVALAGLVVAGAVIVGTLVRQPASAAAPPFDDVLATDHGGGAPEADGAVAKADGAVTEADGVLPDGVTIFDDRYPGVANLDPDLLRALREAATDAADDGVEFYVNSGWRSANYQDQLLREAVSTYGSESAAARWVATPDSSPHVSGDAVDLGSFDATAWLSGKGAEYGLCQVYRNESWHYELRPDADDRGCPTMYADPTHDPRMQP